MPLRGYARAMVRTMTEAGKVPHFYFCDEVCIDALVATRASLRAADPDKHGRLTYLPFLLKAASLALSEFPALNSQLSADGSELLRFASHNIGVAVATPTGLVVPNVKGVQAKSIQQISGEHNSSAPRVHRAIGFQRVYSPSLILFSTQSLVGGCRVGYEGCGVSVALTLYCTVMMMMMMMMVLTIMMMMSRRRRRWRKRRRGEVRMMMMKTTTTMMMVVVVVTMTRR